jgi:Ca2+-binding EF-hand superfamily protein
MEFAASNGCIGKGTSLSRVMFDKYDQDGNGVISLSELRGMLRGQGMHLNESEITLALKEMDNDGNSTISYDEFLTWKKQSSFQDLQLDDETLKRRIQILATFERIDTSCDGTIDRNEIASFHAELQEVGIIDGDRVNPETLLQTLDLNADNRVCLRLYTIPF